jgi:hypothetical protein
MRALQGGVPERPKGTGCKPVGSAYGGSNPPAPTYLLVDDPSEHAGRGERQSRTGRVAASAAPSALMLNPVRRLHVEWVGTHPARGLSVFSALLSR